LQLLAREVDVLLRTLDLEPALAFEEHREVLLREVELLARRADVALVLALLDLDQLRRLDLRSL
jgi:hypothetical protein